jgi:glycerophosphoryl diester phosphodiesterase
MIEVPRLIAHRGASADAPENTLAAFRLAAEQGATWLEFDAMITGDEAIVLHHDDSLARCTGLDAVVSETPLTVVTSLDAGGWFGPAFKGETVPTLAETLALMARLGLGANVEIKPCEGYEERTGELVAQAIARDWPASLPPPVVSSFSLEALVAARPHLPKAAQIAPLFETVPEEWASIAAGLGAGAIHTDHKTLTPDMARAIRAAGLALRCYTVNDPDRARALFALGVTSVFTDKPGAMAAALA